LELIRHWWLVEICLNVWEMGDQIFTSRVSEYISTEYQSERAGD